jgi:RimJ/RimL family protein N-acetyltransferase
MTIPRALETERLILRCPKGSDSAAINTAIRESWSELSLWMEWAQGEPPPLSDTLARAADREEGFSQRTDCSYGAFEKGSGEFAGMFSLFRFDWDVPRGEIGYWATTSRTGKGYATEATLALVELGFSLDLVRIELRCDVRNGRSRGVAERAGFSLEGILKNECRDPQGALRDTCVYARTSSR